MPARLVLTALTDNKISFSDFLALWELVSDSDSSKSASEQLLAKKAKLHNDTLSSESNQHTQESSQWSQNIVIETGHCQDQLNTRHTINVIVNNKKREYQKRYRGRNRDKLKQREAERRRHLQNAEIITELSTSSNIEFTELVHEPIIDEISANSQNVAGLENIQHLFVDISQQNEKGQSSANGTEITNNYSKFRCHQLAHKYFDDKINEYKRLSNKQKSSKEPTLIQLSIIGGSQYKEKQQAIKYIRIQDTSPIKQFNGQMNHNYEYQYYKVLSKYPAWVNLNMIETSTIDIRGMATTK
ncbi:hypothetical protein PV328_001213 [Microctonus aethiopoides]|uniref:Uncharacterized protein n=1 Tax=Microctonus aethiopoides TaxID=144406 RepID=A0AA39FWH7_9HYME|nr:hypothetical protein PV328_001213 [Microctonus aethiopoides]